MGWVGGLDALHLQLRLHLSAASIDGSVNVGVQCVNLSVCSRNAPDGMTRRSDVARVFRISFYPVGYNAFLLIEAPGN